ncbi:MAG TPA: iron ABC transporter permease [Ruminiclostridium sp.]|nr:iron ABC transporter permease [Ruminiclostridium sp.]
MKAETLTQKQLAVQPYSKGRRIKNCLMSAVSNPYNLIVIVSLLLLTYFIVIPLLEMIKTTFNLAESDVRRVPGVAVGDFTLYYWKRLLNSTISRKMLFEPITHSLTIAIFVSILSISLGSCIAWLMVRSDLPGKKFFSLAVIVPYMLPSWCKSMAWITVFKNERIGGSKGFLNYLGVVTPDWLAYGPFAIIAVLTLHYYAYSYLLVSASLRSVNSELEEMGEIAGAGKLKILRKITFPLVLPAILSSFILTFSKSMGTFGVPAFLGMKVNYYTISTMLYNSIKQRQTNIGFALSLILIGIAAINIYINQKAIGTRKSFATIGGKGGRSTLISLGKGRPIIVICLFVFIGFAVTMPLFILLIQTFMLKLGDFGISNLTLHYWIGESNPLIFAGEPGVFKNPQFFLYIKNTLLLVVFSSLIATIVGQILGYITSRGRGRLSGRLIEQMVFIPYLIPSIAFGAIYLSMFAVRRTISILGYDITLVPALYGTFILLVLISVVKNLPFSCRAGTANMMQIGVELEEAAMIEGASFGKRFMKIVLSLSKNGFMSGFMLIFISIMKELDLIVILMTPQMSTLPYMAYSYASGGFDQLSNVVAVIMFIIVFSVYFLANKLTNADISKGFGG